MSLLSKSGCAERFSRKPLTPKIIALSSADEPPQALGVFDERSTVTELAKHRFGAANCELRTVSHFGSNLDYPIKRNSIHQAID
jgi:hypothetical protein